MTRHSPHCTRAMAQSEIRSRFAELLAEGVRPTDAAEQMGFVKSYGRVLLGKIRRDLGWQAV